VLFVIEVDVADVGGGHARALPESACRTPASGARHGAQAQLPPTSRQYGAAGVGQSPLHAGAALLKALCPHGPKLAQHAHPNSNVVQTSPDGHAPSHCGSAALPHGTTAGSRHPQTPTSAHTSPAGPTRPSRIGRGRYRRTPSAGSGCMRTAPARRCRIPGPPDRWHSRSHSDRSADRTAAAPASSCSSTCSCCWWSCCRAAPADTRAASCSARSPRSCRRRPTRYDRRAGGLPGTEACST
jgi:hypothetical protein